MHEVTKIILVEDDPAVCAGVKQALQLGGFEVRAFASAEQVPKHVGRDFPGIVIADVRLPGMSGLELLAQLQVIDPKLPVILITGHGDIPMAVRAMRQGAYDFLSKPFASEHLIEIVRRAIEKRSLTLEVARLQRNLADRRAVEAAIIGQSSAIESVRKLIADVAATPASVLVMGETGTGKELVARCLHDLGSNRDGNFVALNCGGLPESVFESEIFGHEAGAFTGATKRRIGKVEHAGNGTLFLDEIESMPANLQVKFLRVLQERKIERLGSNDSIAVQTRVIAATKDDLLELSAKGRFREDLYYRLNVITIELPPLRERREDILLLFEYFVLRAAAQFGREAPVASSALTHQLLAHAWPGNVRELQNVASRFALGLSSSAPIMFSSESAPSVSLPTQVSEFERGVIKSELRRHNGSVEATSRKLGVPKKTLYDKIRKLQIEL